MPEGEADWTVEEARAYLPRLRGLLAVLRRATDVAVRSRGNGHAKLPGGASGAEESHDPKGSGADPADEPLDGVSPSQALKELAEKGIVLRDPSRGLVDFPSRHPDGRVVLLCWQAGEEDLGWWHLPEDGFAGRRPLPLPPEI